MFVKFSENRKGFTLVELIVSMTLFLTIIAIISGVFIKSMRTQKITMALISANSNAELAIEQMAREMRTGNFTDTLAGTFNSITFKNQIGNSVTYSLDVANGQILKSGNPLTAEDVFIKKLNFIIYKGTAPNFYPPRITIMLQVGAPGAFGPNQPIVNIQTTVSSRNF